MTTIAQQTQQLFVVRLWQEPDHVTATLQWRGSVKHLQSEEQHYFASVPALLAYIATTVDGSSPPASGSNADSNEEQ